MFRINKFRFVWFNTSNVTTMYGLFWFCESLKELDIINFSTSNVTNMRYMFSDCYSLIILDLTNFDTLNVRYITDMFYDCTNLETIYVSELWDVCHLSIIPVFTGCNKLVGGNGTSVAEMEKLDMDYDFIEYAIIDGKNGYLTDIADKPTE